MAPLSTRKLRTSLCPRSHVYSAYDPRVSQQADGRVQIGQPNSGLPESYSHVGQGGTEVLVNVGFQDGVKMLELDVSDQWDNKHLPREEQTQQLWTRPRLCVNTQISHQLLFPSSPRLQHSHFTSPFYLTWSETVTCQAPRRCCEETSGHPGLRELAVSECSARGHSRGDMGQERGDTDRVSVGTINSDPEAANEIFHGILLLSAVWALPITEPHRTFAPQFRSPVTVRRIVGK